MYNNTICIIIFVVYSYRGIGVVWWKDIEKLYINYHNWIYVITLYYAVKYSNL